MKKKLLLFLIVLFHFFILAAQNEYIPLLENGKVLKYSYNNGIRQYIKSLTIGDDTIIGDQTYKKIIDIASNGIEMFLREEGKRVYCCYPYKNTEDLIYDFGKNAGDVISKKFNYGTTRIRKVIAVDTIMVKDKVLRCMTIHEYVIPDYMSEEEYFAGDYGHDSGWWIEGIGSFKGLDSPIGYPGNYYLFYECQIGEETFGQKELFGIFTDIQPKKAVIRANNNDVIYDLQGRRNKGKLQMGIYIKNGKIMLINKN